MAKKTSGSQKSISKFKTKWTISGTGQPKIVEYCTVCGGSGQSLKSVKPFRTVPCWCCYGYRGRTE